MEKPEGRARAVGRKKTHDRRSSPEPTESLSSGGVKLSAKRESLIPHRMETDRASAGRGVSKTRPNARLPTGVATRLSARKSERGAGSFDTSVGTAEGPVWTAGRKVNPWPTPKPPGPTNPEGGEVIGPDSARTCGELKPAQLLGGKTGP